MTPRLTVEFYFEPPGVDLRDAGTGRALRLLTAGSWAGWLCVWAVHPLDGGVWTTLRRATAGELAAGGLAA